MRRDEGWLNWLQPRYLVFTILATALIGYMAWPSKRHKEPGPWLPECTNRQMAVYTDEALARPIRVRANGRYFEVPSGYFDSPTRYGDDPCVVETRGLSFDFWMPERVWRSAPRQGPVPFLSAETTQKNISEDSFLVSIMSLRWLDWRLEPKSIPVDQLIKNILGVRSVFDLEADLKAPSKQGRRIYYFYQDERESLLLEPCLPRACRMYFEFKDKGIYGILQFGDAGKLQTREIMDAIRQLLDEWEQSAIKSMQADWSRKVKEDYGGATTSPQ